VGPGAGQGSGTLLERVLGVRPDKGERYTDGPAAVGRPARVRGRRRAHLPERTTKLWRRAEALGRSEWVAEEHERRYGAGPGWCPTRRWPGGG
jgi:hypothetical protein